MKTHINDSHKGGKEKDNVDLKCEECGDQFNKFTALKMGKLTLTESFDKHKWIHEVVNFKCNCEGIPDLRPGQWNRFALKIMKFKCN